MFVIVRFDPTYGPVVQSVGNYNDNIFKTTKEARLAKRWAIEELQELGISLSEAGTIKIQKLEFV